MIMDLKEWEFGDEYLKKAWWAVRRNFKFGRVRDIKLMLEDAKQLDPVKAFKRGVFDAQCEMMERISRLQDQLTNGFMQFECTGWAGRCIWRGHESETVTRKEEPDVRRCPKCGAYAQETFDHSWRVAMRKEAQKRRAERAALPQPGSPYE